MSKQTVKATGTGRQMERLERGAVAVKPTGDFRQLAYFRYGGRECYL